MALPPTHSYFFLPSALKLMGMLESRLNPEWQLFSPSYFWRGAAGGVQLRGRWRRESWFIKLLLPRRISHLCPLGRSWNHSSQHHLAVDDWLCCAFTDPSSCRPRCAHGSVIIWELAVPGSCIFVYDSWGLAWMSLQHFYSNFHLNLQPNFVLFC